MRRFFSNILFSILILLSFFFIQSLQARSSISPEEAINFVGTSQTVCGTVASVKYLSTDSKAPTFLNLNQPYPDQVFTALIWGENRGKFSYAPEVKLDGKKICVSGLIETYKGKAEIIVSEPKQIRMAPKAATNSFLPAIFNN